MFPPQLEADGTEAVYAQISRALEEEICRCYKSGEFLPAEHILAQRFGVNRHTLRRAVDELVDAGIVERRRGRGTMVLDPAINYPIRRRTRFTDNLETQCHHADCTRVDGGTVAATAGVANELGLETGSEVLWLEILRTVEGWPFSVSSSFFSLPRHAALAEAYTGGSLHACYEGLFATVPVRSRSLVTAVMPRGDDAHRLKIPRNRPLLRIKSLNIHPDDGRPLEYTVTRARSDRIQLEISP